jgi:hypothetical protein
MKKIIATLVLLVLLSAAVFAQDDGSGWKVGFKAQLVRDIFYTTKVTGEGKTEQSTSPSITTDGTYTTKLGDYIQGSSNLNTFTNREGFDQRLQVSLSNNGDHHSVYIDMKLDDTWVSGFKFMDLINGGAADWYFAGDTGGLEGQLVVFDGKVGSGRYGGFVPVYEIWDDYIGEAGENFFGVHKYSGFQPSNNISVTHFNGPWNDVYAVGATFADNYRFAFGSTLASFATGDDNGVASASYAEAGFMLSGRGIAEFVSFDLFYAVKGEDKNTVSRNSGGQWDNLIGVYAGLDLGNFVNGLGVSVGYTANFIQNETEQVDKRAAGATDPDWKTYEKVNPVWSGIDINVKFDGVEKLGVNLNNNISFAGTKVEKRSNSDDDIIVGLSGNNFGLTPSPTNNYHYNENWFAYRARLSVRYGITDRLGVTLALNNVLTVFDVETEETDGTVKATVTGKETNDNLITSLHADYNAGNVTFGIGLTLGINGTTRETESKTTNTGYSQTTKNTGNISTVRFGVPLFFRVAF